MLKIREISDIHNEFLTSKGTTFSFTPLSTDKETVCVLAGDIGLANRPETLKPVLKQASEMFRFVLYVKGNHEHYRCSVVRSHAKIQAIIDELQLDNVFLLENDTFIVDNVAFIGATLWTDFDRQKPHCMYFAQQSMNDYKLIRNGSKVEPYLRKFDPKDALLAHLDSKRYIFDQIVHHKNEGRKVVVVSHHGPTWASKNPLYAPDMLDGAYVSDLSNEILDTNPDVWFHGHVHHAQEYMCGDTRVITNPYGYPGEHVDCNMELIVEV